MVINFPVISWSPLNAAYSITFALVGAPSFLTLTQSGTTAQGVIDVATATLQEENLLDQKAVTLYSMNYTFQ